MDRGFMSRSAVFEVLNRGLGCPGLYTTEPLAPARDREAAEKRVREIRAARASRRAEMLSRRDERRARFAWMHEAMTMKEIDAVEGLSISQVILVLKGKR